MITAQTQADSFRIMGDKGYLTIFSPKYAVEIGNHKALSLDRVIEHELYAHLKGFDPFAYAGARVFQGLVRKKMTQALGWYTFSKIIISRSKVQFRNGDKTCCRGGITGPGEELDK